MIKYEWQKKTLAARRQKKKLEASGYRCHETDWEIRRGGKINHVITDAVISLCGKYVYTKIEARNE